MAYGDGTFTPYNGGYRFYKQFKSKSTGKTFRLSVTGSTKAECRAKMEEKERTKESGLRHSQENPSVLLGFAVTDWARKNKLRYVKASTYDRIERIIENQIAKHKTGMMQVKLINATNINSILFDVAEKNSQSTVSKTYQILNQFFRDYYAANPSGNPMNGVKMPKPQKKIGEIGLDGDTNLKIEDIVLSNDEIKRFKECALKPYVNGKRGTSRYGPALYFMMMTVIRFGEAAALTWKDIDVDNRVMVVSKNQSVVKNRIDDASKTRRIITTPKSGKSREVMLSAEAIAALNAIRESSDYTEPKNFVICTKYGKSVTNHILRKSLDALMAEAGLATEQRKQKFGLHYLRHTGISYYIRNGIPLEMVSKMAGHSSVAITERVYYHIIHDQQQKMLDMMDKISL